MKKVLSVVLVLALCLLMGAWADPKAYDTYEAMTAAMEDITSMEVELTGSVAIKIGGDRMDMLFDASVQQIVGDEDDTQMVMTMNAYILGQKMGITTYYKDGYMYQDTMGEKYKMKLDLEEFAAQTGTGDVDFDRSAIINSSYKDVPAGQQLVFELDPAFINNALVGAMDTMVGDVGGIDNLKVQSVAYTIVAGEDNIMKSYDMEMTMGMMLLGNYVTMDYIIESEIVSINTLTALSYPSDLDAYPELNATAAAATAEPEVAAAEPEAVVAEPEAVVAEPEAAVEPEVEEVDPILSFFWE